MHFLPGLEPISSEKPAYWLAFCGDQLLVSKEREAVELPLAQSLNSLGIEPLRIQYLGMLNDHPCYSAELAQETSAQGCLEFVGLRQFFGLVEEELFLLAGRARQIVEWDKTHQFCGLCGKPTQNKRDERAKVCPSCGMLSYPRISPAIIVAITRGEEILLARGNRFALPMYSVIAGFVEPGETLEQCVQREVQEEVGLEVKNITYFGSQPWPFPNSLMIGFTAEYAAGEITPDRREIVDAAWFKASSLPLIPERISIARRLIDWFVVRNA